MTVRVKTKCNDCCCVVHSAVTSSRGVAVAVAVAFFSAALSARFSNCPQVAGVAAAPAALQVHELRVAAAAPGPRHPHVAADSPTGACQYVPHGRWQRRCSGSCDAFRQVCRDFRAHHYTDASVQSPAHQHRCGGETSGLRRTGDVRVVQKRGAVWGDRFALRQHGVGLQCSAMSAAQAQQRRVGRRQDVDFVLHDGGGQARVADESSDLGETNVGQATHNLDGGRGGGGGGGGVHGPPRSRKHGRPLGGWPHGSRWHLAGGDTSKRQRKRRSRPMKEPRKDQRRHPGVSVGVRRQQLPQGLAKFSGDAGRVGVGGTPQLGLQKDGRHAVACFDPVQASSGRGIIDPPPSAVFAI